MTNCVDKLELWCHSSFSLTVNTLTVCILTNVAILYWPSWINLFTSILILIGQGQWRTGHLEFGQMPEGPHPYGPLWATTDRYFMHAAARCVERLTWKAELQIYARLLTKIGPVCCKCQGRFFLFFLSQSVTGQGMQYFEIASMALM